MFSLILLVFAFVLAVIAALQVGDPIWRKLMAGSLACFFLACILGHDVISKRISARQPALPAFLVEEGW